MQKEDLKLLAGDGKLYAEVTLREIVNSCDLSDTPFLSEYKRLYDENEKLKKLLGYARDYISGGEDGCKRCPIFDACESLPRCTFADYFDERVAEIER